MKRTIAALMIALAVASPVYADYPSPETLTDSSAMTEDQLRIAYDDLKTNYSNLYTEHFGRQTQAGEQWETRYYLDEFGNQTDKPYIINRANFSGTFSNSATTDAKLKAAVYVEYNMVSIALLEYGDNLVHGYYSDGHFYEVNVLTSSGETIGMQGILAQGGSGILLNDYSARFIDLLKEGGELKVSMKETTHGSMDTYLFTIPASSDFAEIYASTFGA